MQKTIHTLLFICFTLSGLGAQSPYLDPSFGFGGRFTHIFAPSNFSRLFSTARQSDGKIVGGGATYINNAFRAAALRCTPDGTLDTTFADHGQWISDDPAFGIVNHILVQPDGKILITGRSGGALKVVRLMPDGSYDTSFGNGGKANITVWSGFNAVAVIDIVLLPNGKIVILGILELNWDEIAMVRLRDTGTVDGSFGSFGIAKLHKSFFGANSIFADKIKNMPDNTLMLTGNTYVNNEEVCYLMRYKINGQIDFEFGENGVRYIPNSGTHSMSEIWVMPDSSLLILGNIYDEHFKSALFKLKPDGTPDSTFAINGIGAMPYGDDSSSPYSGALQPDGKVVVFGGRIDGVGFLGRFNADGSVDADFGDNGTLALESQYEILYDGFVQPDGNIVAASRYQTEDEIDACSLLRYLGSHAVGAIETHASPASAWIYPNPVRSGIFQIAYELPEAALVQIELLDLQGRYLGNLLVADRPAGKNEENVGLPAGLAPGAYLVNIRSSRGNRVVRIAVW
ncbi:MAG: T9SS type A sorting domain-containing protein [Saprospiraceae bacterium]|nr:T9SS type A sorting domain-containing protein [Saprospiraceae bacterium]